MQSVVGPGGGSLGPIILRHLCKEDGEGKRSRGAWLAAGVSQGRNKGPAAEKACPPGSEVDTRHLQPDDITPGGLHGTPASTYPRLSL